MSLENLEIIDPIRYAELQHVLASDPQLAHLVSELFQPHRVPQGEIPAQAQSASDLDLLKLQRMMQARSQMFELLSNVLKKYDQTAKGIIDNMGR